MTTTPITKRLDALQLQADKLSDLLGERYADGDLTGWQSQGADPVETMFGKVGFLE